MKKPNILLILADDMGYSDIGCYGGEADTPNLDRLAMNGLRYTQFYNTARCCPTRASLLTGMNPHQVEMGHMAHFNDDIDGYRGDLSKRCVTIAEVLKEGGYGTYLSGKWHVCKQQLSTQGDCSNWPLARGFDRFYGIIGGAASFFNPPTLARDNESIDPPQDNDYYFTDAVAENACSFIQDHCQSKEDNPFFLFTSFTAPHWPLHARQETIDKYRGRFNGGWDKLREQRLERMIDFGIVKSDTKLTKRDSTQPAWEDAPDKEWQEKRMEVYAAQIDSMDQGIGRILNTLEAEGQLDDTLIFCLSDNGACAEEIFETFYPYDKPAGKGRAKPLTCHPHTKSGELMMHGNDPAVMPGDETTFQSYGVAWANLSNAPFREYKHFVHEGGIATPLIAHWPAEIADQGELRFSTGQLMDIMATVVDVTGVPWPSERRGRSISQMEGESLRASFEDDSVDRPSLAWEHEGNCAFREGIWKLVKRWDRENWELYDMEVDRSELNDLSAMYSDVLKDLLEKYTRWADRVGVVDWNQLKANRNARGISTDWMPHPHD
ncbi:MAG: arylsulfatase [Opitutaceae bacterium]|nr:arylsulfatase [Opitutaceae bacterium]